MSRDIPDLNVLAQAEWKDALRPFSEMDRVRAMNRLPEGRRGDAADVLFDLMFEDIDRKPKFRAPTLPAGVPAEGRLEPRQVNIRITEDLHAELVTLSRSLSMRPAQLAKLFVVRGMEASRGR